jgi:hypothetical protein
LFQDISFKVQRQQIINHHTTIRNENPWRLHQVQDAANHLNQALLHISNIDEDYIFKYVVYIFLKVEQTVLTVLDEKCLTNHLPSVQGD